MIKIPVPQYFRRFCSNAAKRLSRYIRSSTSSHTFFLPGLCSQYISNSSNSQQPCWQPCWYNSSTPPFFQGSAPFIAIEHRCNSNSLQHWCLPCWYSSHTPFLALALTCSHMYLIGIGLHHLCSRSSISSLLKCEQDSNMWYISRPTFFSVFHPFMVFSIWEGNV